MFDDLDFDDDFSDGDGLDLKSDKKSPSKIGKNVLDHGADLAFEAESESGDLDGDFNANELLNFSDYKNKR